MPARLDTSDLRLGLEPVCRTRKQSRPRGRLCPAHRGPLGAGTRRSNSRRSRFRDPAAHGAEGSRGRGAQSAGLLDAWIRSGGLLLDPEHHDVLLAGSASRERTSGGLNQVLVPDLPQGCDLSIDDVLCVLAAIGTEDHRDVSAWVSTDGSWRLGPAHGHFEKERAQFIGATARHNERQRRLEQLDLELDEQRRIREESAIAAASVEASISVLEAWVIGVPSGQKLTSAWTRADERRGAELREEAENRTAQRDAQVARAAMRSLDRAVHEEFVLTELIGALERT